VEIGDVVIRVVLIVFFAAVASCTASPVGRLFRNQGYRYPVDVSGWGAGKHCRYVEGAGERTLRCYPEPTLREFEARVALPFARRHCPTAIAYRYSVLRVYPSRDADFLEAYLDCYGEGSAPSVRLRECLSAESCECADDLPCFTQDLHEDYWMLRTEVVFRLDGSTWVFDGWKWKTPRVIVGADEQP
jgi:hypothetical protein